MTRSEDFRRKAAKKHIHRRENIIKNVYGDNGWYEHIKSQPNRLSKGKIHCSYSLCAFHGCSRQDMRNMLKQLNKLQDYFKGEDDNV